MIAVVTGSSGFIGAHLVDALLARGHTVRALYRPETPARRRDPRVEHHEADLVDDRSVRESGVWRGATHVFHLAGVTRGRTLAYLRAANVLPTANLLAAIAARGVFPRVVLVSSQAAAGPARDPRAPRRESDPPAPVEDYGRSKLEAEQATFPYRDSLPITIVRPSAVYGPRDDDFLAAFRQASRPVAFYGTSRRQIFSIVHVCDLVAALLRAAERPVAIGRTYFVANAEPTDWPTIYSVVSAEAGARAIPVPLPPLVVAGAARVADVVGALTGRHFLLNRNKVALTRPRYWVCDSSCARTDLEWSDSIPLIDGLRETYHSYLADGRLRRRGAHGTGATTETGGAR